MPCDSNGECLSGWCIETPDFGKVCTIICYDECPLPDWICVVGQSHPDLEYICVPPSLSVCEACETNDDCPGSSASCLSIGNEGGRYCSYACDTNSDCPPAYTCRSDGSGAGRVCLPDSGSCVCTAELDGSDRPCTRDNEFGTCFGTQTCEGPDGWSPCSATAPAPEACDGKDNDCDGTFDEELDSTPCQQQNSFGVCLGTQTCASAEGWVCSAAVPGPDVCDNLDNDCDDQVDEDFPLKGQPCDDPSDDDFCAYGEWACAEGGAALVCTGDVAQVELCNDYDDDCDGFTDEPFPDKGQPCDADDEDQCALGVWTCGPLGDAVVCAGDKNQIEVCDGKDNDCDGATDEGFVDLDGDAQADCVDADDDNDGDPDSTDCNDFNAAIKHGATELCDGIDNDCDATVDETFADTDTDGLKDCIDPDDDNDGRLDGQDNCPLVSNAGQQNFDGDAYGDACDGDIDGDGDPNATDCNDYNAGIFSGAAESCNGVDDNCNSQTDEGEGVAGCLTYWKDSDSDAYGVNANSRCYCKPTGDYKVRPSTTNDCCDTDANVKPGQALWFSSEGNCGGYDYNCASGAEKRWSATGACYCDRWFFICLSCASANGWTDASPACGSKGSYITACNYSITGCSASTETRTQECH